MSKINLKNFLISGFCLSTALANARDINVADFGIIPGKDASLPLNELILSVGDEPDVTLIFPKGDYDFYPDRALEKYRAVANHDNSLKRIAFPLMDCKNITINGGDSRFIFHGRIVPFVLDGSSGVTLKNFSIDWKRPFQSELKVVEHSANGKAITVEIDSDEFPYTIEKGQILFDHYDWQDPIATNILFDPKTRSPMHETRDYSLNPRHPMSAKKLDGNRVELTASFSKKLPPVGSVIVTYGSHPTSRLAPAIHASDSKDIIIDNVTVYAAGGMGLIAERCENLKLDHMVVTSTDKRLISTRADATHFIGCKGTIELEHCLFEHMLDDGINVHGAYVIIDEYLGQKNFLCTISHFQQWGLTFAEAGDKIMVMDRSTVLPLFEGTVESVRPINEKHFMVTLENVPAEIPQGPLSMENMTWYPDLVMTHNVIRENRARSALITTKGKVTVTENYFSSQMHGILIEGDNNVWYESGAVEDVTIANNTFVNIGYEGADRYPLYASPLLNDEQRFGDGRYHRNINFTGNSIKSFNGLIAYSNSVEGLNISDNTIELSSDYPAARDFPSIDLHYSDKVTIKGNKFIGFGESGTIRISGDTENVTIEQNENLQQEKANQPAPSK
ncbi:right-handed parallel beta-helix repeat-containing protein [Luteolibacter algae]|uniref:Right-handed parallel beta-helix repeat-containing protein n=1 Tax=Luteolibacter algae TaxID=454151 RepID=A0ABW5D9X8_9BACT